MHVDMLARLIAAADFMSFRELAMEYLRLRGYHAVTLTDGWSDGGTDLRVFALTGTPIPVAFQVTVEHDWKKKLREDAEKVKSRLHLGHMTLVASRRIDEAEFTDIADDLWSRYEVRVTRADCQTLASKFLADGQAAKALQLLGITIPGASTPAGLSNRRAEAAFAFAFFGRDAHRFRDAVMESAIISAAVDGTPPITREALETNAAKSIDLPDEQLPRLGAAVDRLLQRGDLTGDEQSIVAAPQIANSIAGARQLREVEWAKLRREVIALLKSRRPGRPEPQAPLLDTIMESLGALLLHAARHALASLHGQDPFALGANQIQTKLRQLHGTLDALGLPEGSARDQLILDLTDLAERSPIGRLVSAGELFVALSSTSLPQLVRALGARTEVSVLLDASVAIPVLCARFYRPARNRFSIAAHHLSRQLELQAIGTRLPEGYLEESAYHLLIAGRDYRDIVETEPDLSESENAFVAHYASLRNAGQMTDKFDAYLEAFGLDSALRTNRDQKLARDLLMQRLAALFEGYEIQPLIPPRASEASRRRAEEAISYAVRDLDVERPPILISHDTRILSYLMDTDKVGHGAYVLCTWDKLHFHIRAREKADWLAVDPAALGDVLSMIGPEDRDASLRSVTVLVKMLSDAAAVRGADVWDRLVRLERGNLHDAELLKQARAFKDTYIRDVAAGVKVAPVALAWSQWKAKGYKT